MPTNSHWEDPGQEQAGAADPCGIDAVRWRDGRLELLDQRLLPTEERRIVCEDVATAVDAIRDMVVRGAPAIGITAAYAMVLAASARRGEDGLAGLESDARQLAGARPTAVNLGWAVRRMMATAQLFATGERESLVAPLLEEARRIHAEDVAMNLAMARIGSDLIREPCSVITHCNAGALATGGLGTALGVIREGWRRGLIRQVWADETRPWLQGARLTAWELGREGIPVTVIADSAAAQLFRRDPPQWAIVGADRIAANGDTANKIGTYALAVAARHHGVRFMVVAPSSTVDMATPDGEAIPIEERDASEIWGAAGGPTPGAEAANPAFDVTPAHLIDALVTERGTIAPVSAAAIKSMMQD
jgi:methylthioribose-1-phosphate isomerase